MFWQSHYTADSSRTQWDLEVWFTTAQPLTLIHFLGIQSRPKSVDLYINQYSILYFCQTFGVGDPSSFLLPSHLISLLFICLFASITKIVNIKERREDSRVYPWKFPYVLYKPIINIPWVLSFNKSTKLQLYTFYILS